MNYYQSVLPAAACEVIMGDIAVVMFVCSTYLTTFGGSERRGECLFFSPLSAKLPRTTSTHFSLCRLSQVGGVHATTTTD